MTAGEFKRRLMKIIRDLENVRNEGCALYRKVKDRGNFGSSVRFFSSSINPLIGNITNLCRYIENEIGDSTVLTESTSIRASQAEKTIAEYEEILQSKRQIVEHVRTQSFFH